MMPERIEVARMAADRSPVQVSPYGPFRELAWQLYTRINHGDFLGALAAGNAAEGLSAALGDEATYRMCRLARMYALLELGRLDEALVIGAELTGTPVRYATPRATSAKITADVAEVLVRLGRVDEGIHHLARAVIAIGTAPRDVRYAGALSSVCEAATSIELYEFADECYRNAMAALAIDADDMIRMPGDLQHAELLLEWGLRLVQLDRPEQAGALFEHSIAKIRYWDARGEHGALTDALLAVACARTGRYDEVRRLVGEWLVPLRETGQVHEARLLHLGFGLMLRETGDLAGARRELLAAVELATEPRQLLIFRYELAVLAAREQPGLAATTLLQAVRGQADQLWRQRLDRRTMLRQAVRRVELESAGAVSELAAFSDALTGLGNRRLFDRRIAAADQSGVLLLIDVDRFKGINDEFSHGVGDRVLAEIAAVLRAHCRHDEVATRLGGDEFAIFLRTTAADGAEVAERIRHTIDTRDWAAVAPGLTVTLSMGLAPFDPGMTGPQIYDRADASLYSAKRGGRNRLGRDKVR